MLGGRLTALVVAATTLCLDLGKTTSKEQGRQQYKSCEYRFHGACHFIGSTLFSHPLSTQQVDFLVNVFDGVDCFSFGRSSTQYHGAIVAFVAGGGLWTIGKFIKSSKNTFKVLHYLRFLGLVEVFVEHAFELVQNHFLVPHPHPEFVLFQIGIGGVERQIEGFNKTAGRNQGILAKAVGVVQVGNHHQVQLIVNVVDGVDAVHVVEHALYQTLNFGRKTIHALAGALGDFKIAQGGARLFKTACVGHVGQVYAKSYQALFGGLVFVAVGGTVHQFWRVGDFVVVYVRKNLLGRGHGIVFHHHLFLRHRYVLCGSRHPTAHHHQKGHCGLFHCGKLLHICCFVCCCVCCCVSCCRRPSYSIYKPKTKSRPSLSLRLLTVNFPKWASAIMRAKLSDWLPVKKVSK